MSVFYILGAILGLGLLIVVHEAGHFVVARWCGMRVERFSIGFGPAVLRWRTKAGTLFQLAPIPFGGFVEIKGMAIAEDVEPDDHAAYPNRPVWQRIATIFAGPGTNWLTAILLAFGLFTCAGVRDSVSYYGVDALNKDFPAASVLQPGDRILAINGTPLYLVGPDGKVGDLSKATAAIGDSEATVRIQRQGKALDVRVRTKWDAKPGDGKEPRFRLGIDRWQEQYDRVDVGVFAAAGHAVVWPAKIARAHLGGLLAIVQGKAKGEVVGPVKMTSTIKKEIEAGWVSAVSILMLLNVLLAIMNLLPLPGLDGGRLAFLAYELVTRRRANAKVETTVHMVGIMILMVVLVMVTFKECRNLL